VRPQRTHNQLAQISLESVLNNSMFFVAELPYSRLAEQRPVDRNGEPGADCPKWAYLLFEIPANGETSRRCHPMGTKTAQAMSPLRCESHPAERLPTWSQVLRHRHGSASTQWLGSNGAITSAVWSSSVQSFRMNCVVIQRLLHHQCHLAVAHGAYPNQCVTLVDTRFFRIGLSQLCPLMHP
jgi:hypothetical protein